MYLEAYIWCWVHLHPGYLLRKLAKFMGLAALILIPLFYANLELVKRGFVPKPPSFEIQEAAEEPHAAH